MNETVLARVQRIVAALFDAPPESITVDCSPQTLPKWDSMGHLTLVLQLEEDFGVQLTAEEVESMQSIGDVVRVLDAHL